MNTITIYAFTKCISIKKADKIKQWYCESQEIHMKEMGTDGIILLLLLENIGKWIV